MSLSTRTSSLLLPLLALAIAGCGDSDPAAPVNIRPHTFVVENQLLAPVRISLNGIDLGVLNAGATRIIPRGQLDTLLLLYTVQPTSATPFGDTIPGWLAGGRNLLFGVDTVPRIELNADLNGDGSPDIFAPGLKNRTAVPVAVGINMATAFENRAGAVIAAGDTSAKFIGYFFLPRVMPDRANVRVYQASKVFDPNDFLALQFGLNFDDSIINPVTGYVVLNLTQAPPKAGHGQLPFGG